MTLLIIAPTMPLDAWTRYLLQADPEMSLRVWPDCGDPQDVAVVAVWKHPPGSLSPFPNLKCIASLGVGVDHIFSDSELPPDIPITRVVDRSMAQSMSEYVILAVLSYCRQFDRYYRDQHNRRWSPQVPMITREVTVGIMGLGQLGLDAATKLQQMGFGVRGWSRTPHTHQEIQTFAGPSQLDAFLSRCDILVCLLPLTPDTRGILRRSTFDRLPQGAYVINVARGAHLIEADLLDALDDGRVSGACLDVFDTEPLPAEHPFWPHPRILITPHISSLTHPRDVAPQIASNYRRILQGQPPVNCIDRNRGY